jgi:hypothetical protein
MAFISRIDGTRIDGNGAVANAVMPLNTNSITDAKVNDFFQKSKKTLCFCIESAKHFVFDVLPDLLRFLSSKVEQIGIKNLFLGTLGVGALSAVGSLCYQVLKLDSKIDKIKENNRLRTPAQNGDLAAIRTMIANGICGMDLRSLLINSSENNRVEAVKLILQSRVTIRSEDLHMALFHAASAGHLDVVKEILKNGKGLSFERLVDNKTLDCAIRFCTANTLAPIVTKAIELESRCLDGNNLFVDVLFSLSYKHRNEGSDVEDFLGIVLDEQDRMRTSAARRYTNYQLFEMYKRLPIA